MASYNATCRTNYFKVTDEEKYNELFSNLCADSRITDITKESEDGIILHGFGCYDAVTYKMPQDCKYEDGEEDKEYDFGEFLRQLQTILPDDEAFMYFEAGHEKLCYVVGECYVVTSKVIKYINLDELAKKEVQALLGNDFETQTEY